MLIVKGLLVSAALAQTASALYIWIPTYRCILDHTCIASKRTLEADVTGRDVVSNEIPSLKIVQRLPQNHLPHDVQIQRLAERLTRKYSRGGTHTQREAVEQPDPVFKRANAYTIVSAAPPSQTNSAGIDQDGTDYSYFAQVLLGSNNTPLYMLLDTGAGTSWVMGPSCTSAPCKTHNSFGAANSATFQTLPQSFSVAYGSGAVSGMMASDSLSIAGMKFSFDVGIANVTSNDFNAFPIDGILGLSQANGSTPNFLQTMVAAKVLKANVFGMDLNRASDGTNTGEINFGAPDPSRYSGPLGYTPVSTNAEGDWAIPMDNVAVGTTQAGITGKLGYIDTGTSYIFGPANDVATFHALIPGAKSADGVTYSVPCTTTTSISFTFGGVAYSVLSKDWIGPMVNGACTSNVYGHAVVDGQWLMGDTFLKNVYAVFDVDLNRVGFAQKVIDASTTVTASVASTSPTGGPNSLSDSSSTALPSSNTLLITGPSGTTASNTAPAGSSSVTGSTVSQSAASATGTAGSSTTASPGLNGHQTSASSGTAAAETSTAPSATPTKKSNAIHLDTGIITTLFVTLALITFFS